MKAEKQYDSEFQEQDKLYRIPYHYIPTVEKGNFSQTENINWGFEYISFLNYLVELLGNIDFKSLLDVGCGDGRLLREIHLNIPETDLLGIDLSEGAIRLAKALNPALSFTTADITGNRLKGKKFDIITCVEVLEHIPPAECGKFLKNIKSHLKESGTLILSVPSNNTPVQTKHYRHFSLKELESELTPHFTIKHTAHLNRISAGSNLIRKLLTNRLFILNSVKLRNRLYKRYMKRYFIANANNGKRILVIARG